jgi:hypothetical protein
VEGEGWHVRGGRILYIIQAGRKAKKGWKLHELQEK